MEDGILMWGKAFMGLIYGEGGMSLIFAHLGQGEWIGNTIKGL